MVRKNFLYLFVILLACELIRANMLQPILQETRYLTDIESLIREESIHTITNLGTFLKKRGRDDTATHPIQIITLKSGLKGLFKTGSYHYAEVAAYRLSKILGLNVVPPTVFRTLDGVQGSLQLYIDAPDLASISDRHKLLKRIGRKAVSDMKLFYYVAGQWDTHAGNQIVTHHGDTYALWLIDNSGMLHRSYSCYGGETFIEKGGRIMRYPQIREAYFLLIR